MHLALLRLGANWKRISQERVTVHRLDARGNYDPALIAAIWRVIRRVGPDVVLTWLPQMDTLGGLCATIAGVPWVLCERTSYRAYSWSLREVMRRSIANGAAEVVANSREGAAYWAHLARKGRPVEVVPNIVPLAEIDAAVHSARALARPAAPTPTVIAVGRLISTRNLDILVAAWADVQHATGARLLLLGDGPEMARLQQLVRQSNLGSAIQFAGFVDDVVQQVSCAAAYVSLSSVEGRPNATIEAAATGCPMILSDIPEHRNLFSEEEAMFVATEDSTRVAQTIIDTLSDRVRSANRAAAARERVRTAAATDIAEIYNQILRRLVVPARP